MSDETTDNLIQVMREFQWPDPEPVSYRLYHDEQGRPLFYTMESLPGTYIEVDPATYARGSHDVVVQDGKLIVLIPKVQIQILKWNPISGTPCHPNDVCVVVGLDQPHQKWKKHIDDIS